MHRFLFSLIAILALSSCGEKTEFGKVSKEIDEIFGEVIEIIEEIENREDAENAKEEVLALYERLDPLLEEQKALSQEAPDDVIRKYNSKNSRRKAELTEVMEEARTKFEDDSYTFFLVVNLLRYSDKNLRPER